MKPPATDISDQEREWVDALLDESLADAEFQQLQEHMREKPQLRAFVRRSLALHHDLQQQSVGQDEATNSWLATADSPTNVIALSTASPATSSLPLALAAGLAFLLGLASMYFARSPETSETAPVLSAPTEIPEPEARGYAVLVNLFDVRWTPDEPERSAGESLGEEVLKLRSGIAEIQFFSGATMVLQGPAEIALKSAWEATCREGAVRMRVPPAARGFRLNGPETEIVDLGTEFGFEVRDGKAHVEVLDGEITLRHRQGSERIVKKGHAWELPERAAETESPAGHRFPELAGLNLAARSRLRQGFERWHNYSLQLARDPRMIAYYTFQRDNPAAVVSSIAEPRTAELDGAVVLAETTDGRWPGMKQALEFRRPGARVRVRITGEFPAFTFAAWVRIDSLDRRYNALFMADGYENGEPHWQIRDDGKLMLSVMVDESRRHPVYPEQSRFHRVYYSPPVWDLSQSGQWMHLVSVYDPRNKRVTHHVNGAKVSEEKIDPLFQVDTLRIGNGEIGNWGEPFRETPWFAIRNLNGRIDELGIFNAALSDKDVRNLYEHSRAEPR